MGLLSDSISTCYMSLPNLILNTPLFKWQGSFKSDIKAIMYLQRTATKLLSYFKNGHDAIV